jgi:hypothetical protein
MYEVHYQEPGTAGVGFEKPWKQVVGATGKTLTWHTSAAAANAISFNYRPSAAEGDFFPVGTEFKVVSANPEVSREKYYEMNPATDYLVEGDALKKGMRVLIEDRVVRSPGPARSQEFARVTKIRREGNLVFFTARYDDGFKKSMTVHVDFRWIVKRDETPVHESATVGESTRQIDKINELLRDHELPLLTARTIADLLTQRDSYLRAVTSGAENLRREKQLRADEIRARQRLQAELDVALAEAKKFDEYRVVTKLSGDADWAFETEEAALNWIGQWGRLDVEYLVQGVKYTSV